MHQPVVYAGEDILPGAWPFCGASPIEEESCDPPTITISGVAGTGLDGSNGEIGFFIKVTQKHLAMPSSPLIRVTLNPKSSRCFIDPLNKQLGGPPWSTVSVGGEII
mmetsp:Transcript_11014/g.15969  ORF Transcript_11014/g.15969 Transcript_11014/m.15969 type:complete len:107 (+) Transcript_11014:615-935(+)